VHLPQRVIPLRLRLDMIGALSLFRSTPGLLGTEEMALGQAFADVATIGLPTTPHEHAG
jgi:hypothetical protein